MNKPNYAELYQMYEDTLDIMSELELKMQDLKRELDTYMEAFAEAVEIVVGL